MHTQKSILLILITILIVSCQSIKKSYESRNYESAISLFLQKKKISDEDITYFEKAYNAALERDKEQIVTLKSLNQGDRWEAIFDLYSRIDTRQNNVLRILPLYYSNGQKANIDIFDFTAALEESRKNAAEYYYNQGVRLLNADVKSSIRQSVDYFIATKKFYINYKNVNESIEEAFLRGRNNILLLVDKNPSLLVPDVFEQSILAEVKLTQNTQWLNFDYHNKENVIYDYIVKLNLYDIQVSPDALKEKITTEEKTIQDGWQYVLDSRGNVRKDSLGNDIKTPKYVKITCQVKEIYMEKSARVLGEVTIYSAQTKEYLRNQKCIGNASFNYSYFQTNGNRDALCTATLNKLRNPPAVFPNTFEMVDRSKVELIRCFKDFIQANYGALAYAK